MKFLWVAVALIGTAAVLGGNAVARDDGRYAGSPLKSWFDSLRSGKGPCCSDADGSAVADVDWESKDGHYRVRLEGEWIDVPDDGLADQRHARDFDPLFSPRQHDVVPVRVSARGR